MLKKLNIKLKHYTELKERLESTLHGDNFSQIEELFLDSEEVLSGIGSLDIAKIGFFSANQDLYEKNAELLNQISKQVEQLASFDTQVFIKALYNRQFE